MPNSKILYELIKILEPHDNWFNDSGNNKNNEAKDALILFYQRLKKIKPDNNYHKGMISHFYYLRRLLNIKTAFYQKKYMRVCNEISTLICREPFLQGRIYYNILEILEEELIREGSLAKKC